MDKDTKRQDVEVSASSARKEAQYQVTDAASKDQLGCNAKHDSKEDLLENRLNLKLQIRYPRTSWDTLQGMTVSTAVQ